MSKIDLIDNGWVDLVFEGRNKAYGAYQLRKNTGVRNVWSIIIMVALAALLAALFIAATVVLSIGCACNKQCHKCDK